MRYSDDELRQVSQRRSKRCYEVFETQIETHNRAVGDRYDSCARRDIAWIPETKPEFISSSVRCSRRRSGESRTKPSIPARCLAEQVHCSCDGRWSALVQ